MLVIENQKGAVLKAISQACAVSNIPVVLWNPTVTSAKEMCDQFDPECVIMSRDGYMLYSQELSFACKTKLISASTLYNGINDRFIKVNQLYCVNPIINTSIPEMESYKVGLSIINDYKMPNVILHTIISILKQYNVTNYRVYGPRIIDSPHFVGNIDQTSYGYIYKNSNVLDYDGSHYGNAELHGNKTIVYYDLEYVLSGKKYDNQVDFSQNCFRFLRNILEKAGLDKYIENVNIAEQQYICHN